jgi:tetratricopeptide (TPR) repeat protein
MPSTICTIRRPAFFSPVAALLLLALGLPAVDEPPKVDAAAVPPVPSVPAETPAADLLRGLPPVASLVERAGKAMWIGDDPTLAYQVVAIDKDENAVISTDIGHLTVARKLLVDNRTDALARLPALIAHAKGAQLKADGLLLREGILTGMHLFSAQTLVLSEGVLKRQTLEASDRANDRTKVAEAATAIEKSLAMSAFDEPGRRSLIDVLHKLSKADSNEQVDEVTPGFARRLVRGGWLRKLMPDQAAAVTALELAIAASEKFQPVMLYEGTGLKLAEVSDAFDRKNRWILTTPTRVAYVQPHEEPLYYWALAEPGPTLAVDLPPGSDPTAVNESVVGVRLFQGSTLLASWNKSGFSANRETWRQAYPWKPHKGVDPNAVADAMPPHIVLTALNGDIVRLYTAHGTLTPPKDGSTQDAERFLAESAKSLPDPAHLDLIGQYVLSYVYDSPDSRFPFLVGNKQVKSDIHQTALQTIATATCGMIRGDCDDLSELYQTIAERQGRTAHVIALPQHAAMAFAEKKEDGNWHTYLLQTGPALEFSDAKLETALEKLYKSFDEGESFDPNGLGLLLRFSGENTRGPWRLSWRIFSEPEYAKTMIDVQRDWHYQTYQRGIAKMKKLIADGDQDNANFRELSGLYSFTGQYDLAVQYHRQAIERTTDPENRLSLTVELVQHLFDAKQDAEARKAALDVLDQQLPKLKKNPEYKEKIAQTQAQVGLELAGALVHGKAYDLALRALKDTQLEDMAAKITQVGEWLNSPKYNQRAWDNAPQLLGMRRLFLMYSGIAVEVLDGIPQDELTTNADLQLLAGSLQDWLTMIAFHDIDEPEDSLSRYSIAGRFYTAMLGQDNLMKLIDSVELPKKNERDHAKRIGGLAQLQLDLPFVKLSVPFWSSELMQLFERERTTLDKKQVALLAKQVKTSYDASKALGLEHNLFERNLHLVQVINAVVNQDANVLRERLKWVKEKDDKRLRDDTAQWLGDVARFVPLDWYQQVIQIWKDELNYKPKYYWIAWRAALNSAPQHALKVAEFAKNEFKDDLSFTEEYDFMKALFAQPKAAVPAPVKKEPAAVK